MALAWSPSEVIVSPVAIDPQVIEEVSTMHQWVLWTTAQGTDNQRVVEGAAAGPQRPNRAKPFPGDEKNAVVRTTDTGPDSGVSCGGRYGQVMRHGYEFTRIEQGLDHGGIGVEHYPDVPGEES